MKIGDILAKRHEVDVVLVHVDTWYDLVYSFFNLGLLYVATILRDAGFRVRCVKTTDLFKWTRADLQAVFTMGKPKLVGFYTLCDNIDLVRDLARDVKSWLPDTRVVIGGPLASVADERLMDFPDFDYAVRGEGEHAMLRLLQQAPPSDVEGLTYRDNGALRRNPQRILRDLDALPFPDHTLLGGRPSHVRLVTSRGCPYQCTFCFRDAAGRVSRFRSADRVVDEIVSSLERYDAHALEIMDDTFTVIPKRVEDICKGLIHYRKRTGRDFVFYCEGRVDVLEKHPHLIALLRDAGLVRLQIGVESGDPEVLHHYRKRINLDSVENVIRMVGEAGGIGMVGNIILGAPYETRQSFEKSVEFAKRLLRAAPGVFEVTSCFMCPYPGTEITENPHQYGLRVVDDRFRTGLTLSYAQMESVHLDVKQVQDLQPVFLREIDAEMLRLAQDMPHERLAMHYGWARHNRMRTLWHLRILSRAPVLDAWFAFADSPRFGRLEAAPDVRPMRTLPAATRTPSGGLSLDGWFRPVHLRPGADSHAYELADGTLPLTEIAVRVRDRHHPDATVDETLRHRVLPLMRRLRRSYHVIAHR